RAALVVQDRPERIPLSYAQSRLWFVHGYEGPSATYNVPLALRLRGALDVSALVGAVGDVVARHESLRTVFPSFEGVPWQQIVAADGLEVAVGVREVAGGRALADALVEAASYRFDLATEIPIRVELLRVSALEHVVAFVIHHIAADGASLVPLARDLTTAYAARCGGRVAGWSGLAVQYADYTLWQRGVLGAEDDPESVLARQFGYWREELAGAPERVVLPWDRSRPERQSFAGEVVGFSIDAGLRGRLQELARRGGATLSMVLQAALVVLLRKLGVGDDVCIGGPIAGRTDAGLADLVGFFVNTWVLRVDTSGNQSFAELLAQVRAKALAAYENQDAPFERLVELLNPARSTAHHPLFQVAFALQNNPVPRFELPGLAIEAMPVPTHTAKFDLSVYLVDLPAVAGQPLALPGSVEYATDLFDRSTVEGFIGYYLRILDVVSVDAGRGIDTIDIIDHATRVRLLADHTVAAASEVTMAELFAAQVERIRDGVAVIDGQRRVSYAQLAGRARGWAGRLKALGAGPETLVAVALPVGVELITALVAIIECGAGYLPIDVGYPSQRTKYMLDDAGPLLIVTDAASAADLPETGIRQVFWEQLDAEASPDEVLGEVDGQGLAYVMYTSGSTGVPKAVAVTHRNVVGLVGDRCWDAHERVLVHSSVAFDASVYEIWVGLLRGAGLVVDPGGGRDVGVLAGLIAEHGVSALCVTPVVVEQLGAAPVGSLGSLRQLCVGGDVLGTAVVARLVAAIRGWRCSMGMGRPRPRCVPRLFVARMWVRWPGRWCLLGGRCSRCGCLCWMRGCRWWRRGWLGSCISRGVGWRVVMPGGRG
ncbi:AMP-binding protein, partial [Mycobacterium szulgai]|nr:AMP-binding protein [Mycobacterium szulgai]